MRKLSFWAKENPWKARITIILSHVVLICLGLFIGKSLLGMNIHFSTSLLYLFALGFIITALLYPSKKTRKHTSGESFYRRQKTCDLLLATTTFFMVIGLGNKNTIPVFSFQPVAASVVSSPVSKKPSAAEILASMQYRDKSMLSNSEKRILKREFKVQLKNYAVAKVTGNKADGDKAALILLAIIGAVGLLYLVAALACGVACNGSDGAAIVILLLGTALVVWALIAVIHAINHRGKKKNAVKEG